MKRKDGDEEVRNVFMMVGRVNNSQWVDDSDDDDEFSLKSSKCMQRYIYTLLSFNEEDDNFKHPPMVKKFPPVVRNFPPEVKFLK